MSLSSDTGKNMQFALLNGQRIEAAPGLSAICPGCGAPLVAKCGRTRVWHWAHRGQRSCDPWWEPETEWHRRWKSHFPVHTQEVRQQAEDGEWHIADVKTSLGLVFEFQHSHLDPEERAQREAFYDPLVWVVDGCRLKRDARNFALMIRGTERWTSPSVRTLPYEPDGCPRDWSTCRHPVIFDFTGSDDRAWGQEPCRLWALLPGRVMGNAIFLALSARDLVQTAVRTNDPLASRHYLAVMRNSFEKLAKKTQPRRARF